jgi:hypothetical protein
MDYKTITEQCYKMLSNSDVEDVIAAFTGFFGEQLLCNEGFYNYLLQEKYFVKRLAE